MQTKKEANVEHAKLFAMELLQRNPDLSFADLEREIQLGWHVQLDYDEDDKKSKDAGVTLARWAGGRARRVQMKRVQEYAQVALVKGLLPPLSEGMLRRPDVFLAADQTLDADEVWEESNKKMLRLEKLQVAAIEAVNAFAAALEEDTDLLVVDASIVEENDGRGYEIGAADVLALGNKIAAVKYKHVAQGHENRLA